MELLNTSIFQVRKRKILYAKILFVIDYMACIGQWSKAVNSGGYF